jgi:formylglycine-generating enzyme required for sulfatase activity
MSDIFISYASIDEERVRPLAHALEAEGWSVFWDRTIPPGETWVKYIGQALDQSHCVVVIWSRASVESSWVYEEAERGRQRGVLIPVLLDDVLAPLGFASVQAAKLIGWDGATTSPGFQELRIALARRLGPSPAEKQRKAEEEGRRAEAETKRKAEEEQQQRTEQESRRKADEKRRQEEEAAKREAARTPAPETTEEPPTAGQPEGARLASPSIIALGGIIVAVLLALVMISVSQREHVTAPDIKPPVVAPTTVAPDTQRKLAAGQVFSDRLKDGSKGPAMVVIPAGTFLMGNPKETKEANILTIPPRRVTIGKRFAMSKYLVTFDDYDRFTRAVGRDLARGYRFGRGSYPVDVTWHDAVAYAEWLSQETGKRYRLPSEAEWEYAARAGTTTDYWWGDKIGSPRPNYPEDGAAPTVYMFKSNPFGIAVTVHYVWEWVQDCWSFAMEERRPLDGTAWLGGKCSERVIRGGEEFRVWERDAAPPDRDLGGDPIGFRLAQDID